MLEGRHTFTVETLLGRRDESSLAVCARAMAEKLLDAGCLRYCLPGMHLSQYDLSKMVITLM